MTNRKLWHAEWCDMSVVERGDVVLKSTDRLMSTGVGEAGILVVRNDGVKIGIEIQAASVNFGYGEIIDGYSESSLFILYFGKLYLIELQPEPKLKELDIFPCNRNYVRNENYVVFKDFFRIVIVRKDGSILHRRFHDVTEIEDIQLNDEQDHISITIIKNWGEKLNTVLDLREAVWSAP
jgi:hypothetical protein